MVVELRPLGVSCNLACTYCYQDPQRAAGNHRQRYDLEAMKAAVERTGGPLTLFGGEPLLVDFDDLRSLLEWGFDKYGETGIQTNGALITDAHIELFERCGTRVGISIDGPGELNDARRHPGDRTRETTSRIEETIAKLAARPGRPPGLIVTLHRGNATADKLPRMSEWFRALDAQGIRSVRLHLLEVDDDQARPLALTPRENVDALLCFLELQGELAHLRFDIVSELTTLLSGEDEGVSCVWRACDPYTTAAVQGVEGNGQSSNCGRTNKDGVDFVKADEVGFQRYVALYHTPQEHGGCQGCRFFAMCKGQCPGTAVAGDWRNRTEHCHAWMTLFTYVERWMLTRGTTPITLSPARWDVEAQLVDAWGSGRNPRLSSVSDRPVGPQWSPERLVRPSATPVHEHDGVRYLGFTMPRFVRHSWVDAAARQYWEPRLRAVEQALGRLAVLSVAHGLVRAAVREIDPGQALALTQLAGEHDLAVAVLARGHGPGPSGPAGRPRAPLPPDVRRRDVVAIGSPRLVAVLARLYEGGCWAELEQVLEYPDASRAFAARVFDDLDRHDAVWSMAQQTARVHTTEGSLRVHRIDVAEAPSSNVLLAGLGIAATPFQPTSFACPDAAAFTHRLVELARFAELGPPIDLLLQILSWPMEWTALHGIAELKTPVLKLTHATDATADKLVVRYLGAGSAARAAQGLGFPYRDRARGLPVVQEAP